MTNFYLTTAIAYMNGSPHCGHTYEIIIADIITKYHQLLNKNTFFSTGSDCHGTKISETAKKNNMNPMELCEKYGQEFQKLYESLNINYDKFIKTTDDTHKEIAKNIWNTVTNNDDIYFGQYTGWYNATEEKFVSNTDALKTNYIDPLTNKPLIKYNEPSYFFRLSKYQTTIIDHITNNPNFIFPIERRDEILNKLKSEPLEDLSISRQKSLMDWGIDIDGEHVIYVWFDALINYLSAIDYPTTKCWPPTIQIIGKDICWFHCVIWPAMLMSLKLELPTCILAHGFVNDTNGLKMSKSIGNTIDPFELLNQYDPDIIRCYLASTTNIGPDLNVSTKDIEMFHDHQLVAKYSNLINRCLTLITKLNQNQIPNTSPIQLFSLDDLKTSIINNLQTFKTKDMIQIIFSHLDIINKYITTTQPWIPTNDYLTILKTSLEAIYIISHYLYPFMPNTTNKFFEFINHTKQNNFDQLTWTNLKSIHLNPYTILLKQIKTRITISDEDKEKEKLRIKQIQQEKKNKKIKQPNNQ